MRNLLGSISPLTRWLADAREAGADLLNFKKNSLPRHLNDPKPGSRAARKIKPVMFSARRIEECSTMRAPVVARHVFVDRHLISASAAKNRSPVPLLPRPHLDRMARQSLVAVLAGVINAAAFHLDRDNVEFGPIVQAARPRVQIDSANFMVRELHPKPDYRSQASPTRLPPAHPKTSRAEL